VKAGIIAAGEGSRLAQGGIPTPKPLVEVCGVSLLERTLRLLAASGIEEVALIVNEAFAEVASVATGLGLLPVRTVIKSTESSMHSLHELAPLVGDARFVLCTVDSIVLPAEFTGFVDHFRAHPELDLLLSYTDFVDDEKPLYIGVAEDQRVLGLGDSVKNSPHVTVGLYGMSPAVLPNLEKCIARGTKRLRNFLGQLLHDGVAAQGYRLSKAVDVDRPSDVRVAEDFLREHRI